MEKKARTGITGGCSEISVWKAGNESADGSVPAIPGVDFGFK